MSLSIGLTVNNVVGAGFTSYLCSELHCLDKPAFERTIPMQPDTILLGLTQLSHYSVNFEVSSSAVFASSGEDSATTNLIKCASCVSPDYKLWRRSLVMGNIMSGCIGSGAGLTRYLVVPRIDWYNPPPQHQKLYTWIHWLWIQYNYPLPITYYQCYCGNLN